MKKKVIAIGGGSMWEGKRDIYPISRQILKRSGKNKGTICFIPTASKDSQIGIDAFQKYYGTKFGCTINVLKLYENAPDYATIREMILSSDIVYVGGGNTKMMIEIWKTHKVDALLKEAYEKGIVMSGLSAGGICWFKYGNSDSNQIAEHNESVPLIQVDGLGWFDLMFCPHYDEEKDREPSLKEMTKGKKFKALGVDRCAAIEIVEDEFRILTTKPTANVYLVYWQGETYIKKALPKDMKFRKLSELI
ncbi:MAG: peptidase E [Alphaproteobacteria bacterium]|nr:peptidase E [Alphaproteobacteria bacterium]